MNLYGVYAFYVKRNHGKGFPHVSPFSNMRRENEPIAQRLRNAKRG